MKKSIFITGASSGLGKSTAILFAEKGWNVIATMRKPSAEKDLGKYPSIQLMELDVTNAEQVQSTVKKALEAGEIDVVFNNAGYGLAGPFEGATEEEIQRELDTNIMGVFRVTQAFLPYFRNKKKGMFITTTSIGGHMAFPFNSVYHATKWALEGWTESVYYEMAQLGIQIKTVAPGGIITDFAGRSLVLAKHPAYEKTMDHVYKIYMDPKQQKDYSTPEQIAQIVYTAATDGKNKLRYIAGKDAKTMLRFRKLMGYPFMMKQVEKIFFKGIK